jgi:RNA 2',3'-cyclic 3'-phosphodiesterase
MSITRVFISAEITERDEILNIQNKIFAHGKLDFSNAKKVNRDSFHFTLVFIGEVDSASLDQIMRIVSSIKFSSFEFNFAKIGGFPNTKYARIGWVGIEASGERKMSELAEAIGQKLSSFIVKEKSHYIPHITLFRLRNGTINLESMLARHNINMNFRDRIEEINLKKSILTSSGPHYSNIVTVKAE